MEQEKKRSVALIAAVVALLLLTSVFVVTIYLPGSSSTGTTAKTSVQRPEESLEDARKGLAQRADLATCREAMTRMNDYVRRASVSPPALTAEQRQFLKEHLRLDEGELEELDSSGFTLLDEHYLEHCFLFRDALKSLRGPDEASPPLLLTRQLATAFAWVVRHVQLREAPGEPAPPAFVLRRGHGTSLERSLVFLSLLQQMNVPGCLISVPGRDGPRLWACGALVEADGGNILLFDPRLGLPLPGPKGEGIASLAEVRQSGDVLRQLTVDEKHPYDITVELAAKAEVYPFCLLSACAPRMDFLQARLQDPNPVISAPLVNVNLMADTPALLQRYQAAAGKGVPVRFAAAWAGVQRRFLSPDDGGTGVAQTQQELGIAIVPWHRLPVEIHDLKGAAKDRLQTYFGLPFLQAQMESGQPRDLLLRGQFAEASTDLVRALRPLEEQKDQLKTLPADWRLSLQEFMLNKMTPAEADLRRAQRAVREGTGTKAAITEADQRVLAAWKEGERLLRPLIFGTAAESRQLQLSYLIALAKHDQAEQMQARLDRTQSLSYAELAAARAAWETAAGWWQELREKYAGLRHEERSLNHPLTLPVISSRRQEARARLAIARIAGTLAELPPEKLKGRDTPESLRALAAGSRQAASHLLANVDDLPAPEITAHLFLARRALAQKMKD